jgi:thiol-disulfide isomerase/thioredoxin
MPPEANMTNRLRPSAFLVAIGLLVVACSSAGGSASTASAPPVTPAAPTPAPVGQGPTGSPMVESPAPVTAAPPAAAPPTVAPVIDAAWANIELTDAGTGQPFRIADLAGRTVIVEPMAIWCVNCRAQQMDVYSALDELDPERVAYVLLDVDPNETEAALADYRTQNGFTGTYAIAGRETARALAEDFGDQVLNPPSTPMILIGTDGRVTFTEFGHKSAETILQLARDHGA